MQRRDFFKQASCAAAALTAGHTFADTPRPPIRIGQIGVGHGHATKLAVYRRSPDYEVVGVVEPDEALRNRAETVPAFRDVKWMTREELLNVPGLQAVLVETRVRDLLDN